MRRAALLGAASLIAALSCGREMTGPPGMAIARGFTFDARFDGPGLPLGVAGELVDFTRVRVVLVNAVGDTVIDEMVDFPSTADSVPVAFDVPVRNAGGSGSEAMSLALAFVNAQGDTVFRGGPLAVQVAPQLPGQAPPAPPVVPVNYTGVGSNAASVVISPNALSVLSGDPFAFTAVALDGQGQPIASTPIAWRSATEAKALITAPGAGNGTTLPSRGPAMIIAQLLTGPADTVMLDIQPRAQSLVIVSGNNQNVSFNAPVPQPIVVRVNATDGLGMQGVTVNFAVATGGGNVSAPSQVTDANGLASVTWTAGAGFGAQTVTVTSAGLAGSPLTFTALAPTAQLLHHYPMNGNVDDAIGGAHGALVGDAFVADGALTTDGATGYAQFATNLIPTTGSYTVSLFVRNRTSTSFWAEYISQGTLGDAFYIGHDPGGFIRAGDQWLNTTYATPAIDGLFHHFVVTVDSVANVSRFYADGVLRGTINQRLTSSAASTGTRLGRQHSDNLEYLDGEIDEVRIYRGALDAAQVATLHSFGTTTPGRLVFAANAPDGAAGAVIAPPIVVRAEDGLGRLRTEFTGAVSIGIFEQIGVTLGGTTTVNAVGGLATFNDLTIAEAGGYEWVVSAAGVSSARSTPFDINAATATALVFTTQPSNSSPGVPISPSIQVQARDQFGNLATGFSGAVTLALAANPGGSTLGGTLTVNADNGVATFPGITLSAAGTGYTLSATAPGVTGATSSAFNIASGAPVRLEFQQQPSTATAGIAISPAVTVVARDAGGNIATSFNGRVDISLVNNPTGSAIIGALGEDAVNGVATFTDLRMAYVGTGYTLGATALGLASDTSAAFDVANPGAAWGLEFSVQPSGTLAGQVLAPSVQVRARDSFGNIATGFTGNVTLAFAANPGAATLGGTLTRAATAGVATFDDLTVNVPASGYTLQASAAGVNAATSTAFSISAGALVNSWTNVAGGNWSVPGNWSLGRAPEPTDTVMILLDGTYTVSLDVNDTVGVMLLGGGTGVQTLSQGARTLRVETALAIQATGQLAMATGGNLTGPGTVGNSGTLLTQGGTISANSFVNNGRLVGRGTTLISSPVTTSAASDIEVLGSVAAGAVALTFSNGFLNNGLIELTTQNAGYNVGLAVPTLTNSPTGTISVLPGTGGARVFTGTLVNQGAVTIATNVQFNGNDATHLNTGTITLTTGDLLVTQAGTAPTFTNNGTIVMGTRTLTIADGSADFSGGVLSGGGGLLVTTGAPSIRFTAPSMQPRVSFSATTVLPDPITIPAGDSLRVRGGTFAPPSLTNDGLLILESNAVVTTNVSTGSGSTIRVRGSSAGSTATVTFTNPLTNSALIELTSINAGFTAQLIAPSITNTSTGTITNLAGAGGGRTLTTALTNEGTLAVTVDLALNAASADHLNSGTITLTGGNLNIQQTGTTPSFTNTGTIATNGRTISVSGGEADFTSGVVTGGTGLFTTFLAPTVRFLTSTMQPRVSLSAGTILPDAFTIPAGDSLRVLGGVFAPPSLTNLGMLVLESNANVTTAVTTGPGSLIRVRGDAAGGAATPSFTNPLTNSASIELTSESAGYTVSLTAPSLTNTSSGVISSLNGAGGARTLVTQLINQGTVNVPHDLTLNQGGAAHVNSGTITLAGADLTVTQTGTTPSFTNTGTIVTNGRTVTVSNGLLDLSAGSLQGYTGFLVTTGTPTVRFLTSTVQPRVTFSAGTILPDPFTVPAGDSLRVRGGTFAPPSLTNDGVLYLEGATTINTNVTTSPGSTIRVRGSSIGGAPTATFTNALTNAATLDLTTEAAGYTVIVTAPSLTNTSTGTINSLAGAGGARTIAAQLANLGAINVLQDLTLNAPSAAHGNGGTITLTGADLTVTQTGTTPSFTNTGTIVTNGRTVTVSNGLLDLSAGQLQGYTGFLVTTGAPTVHFFTSTVQPRVTFSAGTVLPDPFTIPAGDSLRVRGGTFAPPSLTNAGVLYLEGATTINTNVTTNPGSTIRVRGSSIGGAPTATFTNPLTNAATLDLTAEAAGYTVIVTAPSLTNTSTGTINSLAGAGGARTIAAQLANLGAINVLQDLTLNAASAAHANSGTITLTGADLTVTQTGTAPSFTNTGTIVTNGRTVTVSNGLLDLQSGVIGGYTGFLVTTGTPTVRFLTSTVQPRVTFSAGTILPDPFTIPAGDSLRVRGGTFAPPSLTNAGVLYLEGATTINTNVTTNPGSTIRVRGSSIGGAPTATFTNPLTNAATLDLTAESAGYTVTLTTSSLHNTSSGTINSLAGAGGARTIVAQLTNDGAVNVLQDLTLNAPSAAHVNAGTIALAGADLTVTQTGTAPSFTNTGTVTTNGRTVTFANGLVDLSAGLISDFGGFLVTTGSPTMHFTTGTVQPRVTLSAGTVLPDPFTIPAGDSLRLRGGAFAPPSLTNSGALYLEGTAVVNTNVTTAPGSLIRVRGISGSGAAAATFSQPLTNSATLDLTAEDAGYTVSISTPGLLNTSSGVINALTGAGGVRTIAAQLTNDGAVNVPHDLVLNAASAAHVNAGTITLTTGDLTVTQTGTAPSFTNTGTIAVGTRTVSVGGGLLDLDGGQVTGFSGSLTTTGTPTLQFTSGSVQPRLTLSAGTSIPTAFTVSVGDSLRLRGGNWAASSTTVNGAMVLEGTTSVAGAINVAAGGVAIVRGSSGTGAGAASANFNSPITNAGTFRMTAQDAGYSVTATLGTNTFTNSAGGTVDFAAGSGGTRSLTAGQFENLGTWGANHTATLSGPFAQRGTLTVAATRTLTFQSLLTLHPGSTTTATGTITLNGSCSNLGGAFTGFSCP